MAPGELDAFRAHLAAAGPPARPPPAGDAGPGGADEQIKVY
jgi:hypothetical protein